MLKEAPRCALQLFIHHVNALSWNLVELLASVRATHNNKIKEKTKKIWRKCLALFLSSDPQYKSSEAVFKTSQVSQENFKIIELNQFPASKSWFYFEKDINLRHRAPKCILSCAETVLFMFLILVRAGLWVV